MRLYGFMIVRNEADIVAESVLHNLRHLDGIAVTDNGSDDGTLDILQRIAANDRRIHPFSDKRPFNSRIFHHAALRAKNIGWCRRRGDWVIQCDCDEFHESDVRAVCEAAGDSHVINGRKWQFALLPDSPTEGPLRERLRWYYPKADHELRAYRNPRWFFVRGVVERYGLKLAPYGLDTAHYQYRSPEQIEIRLAVRRDASRTHRLHYWTRNPGGMASDTCGLLYRDVLDGWRPAEVGS